MYKSIIRPFLFLFPPETVHGWIVNFIKFGHKCLFFRRILSGLYIIHSDKLERNVAGLRFKNPVGLAAGFDKNASFYKEFGSFGFSHIEIGTVTPKAQPGNPKPRSFRLPADRALINRMGINNYGADHVAEKLKKRPGSIIIGGNIGKNTLTPNNRAVEDFAYCFEKLYDCVDYFVVNISCPNIGDIAELQDQDTLEIILGKLCELRELRTVRKPVFLKLSPDLNFRQVDQTIRIIQELGIDGVVATNTTITRQGLTTAVKKVHTIGNGGLSGAPLKERSTEMIRYIKEKTNGSMPVIGAGGIMSAEDALEKLNAGADLIQIYTGFIYEGPSIVKKINQKILEVMQSKLKR